MFQVILFVQEKFEDNKGVITNRKSKGRQFNDQQNKGTQDIQYTTNNYHDSCELSFICYQFHQYQQNEQ
jgi:hypothetical protein